MDQGCPLSGITFQFYNADLLDITRKGDREDSVAVVDDTTILARGANLEDAFRIIRPKGALEWLDLHDCEFALNKFGLMGFTRRRTASGQGSSKTHPAERPSLKLRDFTIESKDTHKFLGVIMDQELRFKAQTA
jgi:hypothetical protein